MGKHDTDGVSEITLTDSQGNVIDPATSQDIAGIAGLVQEVYTVIDITYTDTTKEFLDVVVFKNGATTVATITATYPSTIREVYTKTP